MATSISYIHLHNSLVIKTIYQVVNVTTTEFELFTIRYSINKAVKKPNVNRIVIITNSLHAARKIFDSSLHPYQIQSISISCKLRDFFNSNINNCINFWDCSSKSKWTPHSLVDKNTRMFNISPIYLCKLL